MQVTEKLSQPHQSPDMLDVTRDILERGDIVHNRLPYMFNIRDAAAVSASGCLVGLNSLCASTSESYLTTSSDIWTGAAASVVVAGICRISNARSIDAAVERQVDFQSHFKQPAEVYRFGSGSRKHLVGRWYGFDAGYTDESIIEDAKLENFAGFVQVARKTGIGTITVSARVLDRLDQTQQAEYNPRQAGEIRSLHYQMNVIDTLADKQVICLGLKQAEKLVDQLNQGNKQLLLQRIMDLLHQKQPGGRATMAYKKWQSSQSTGDYKLFQATLKNSVADSVANELSLTSCRQRSHTNVNQIRPTTSAYVHGSHVMTIQSYRPTLDGPAQATTSRRKILAHSLADEAAAVLKQPRATKPEALLRLGYALTLEDDIKTKQQTARRGLVKDQRAPHILPFQQRYAQCIGYRRFTGKPSQLADQSIEVIFKGSKQLKAAVAISVVALAGASTFISSMSMDLMTHDTSVQRVIASSVSSATTAALRQDYPRHHFGKDFQPTTQQIATYETQHPTDSLVMAAYALRLDGQFRNQLAGVKSDLEDIIKPHRAAKDKTAPHTAPANLYGGVSTTDSIGDVTGSPGDSSHVAWTIQPHGGQSDIGYWSQVSYQTLAASVDTSSQSETIPSYKGLSIAFTVDKTLSMNSLDLAQPAEVTGKYLKVSGEISTDQSAEITLPVLNGMNLAAAEVTTKYKKVSGNTDAVSFAAVQQGSNYDLLLSQDIRQAEVTYWLTPQTKNEPAIHAAEPIKVSYVKNGFTIGPSQPLTTIVTPTMETSMQSALGTNGHSTAAHLATIISRNRFYDKTPVSDNSNLFDWNNEAPASADELIANVGKALSELPDQVCNTAATTTLLLSAGKATGNGYVDPEVGYYNNAADSAHLTTGESHEWLVDNKGSVIDATPYGIANRNADQALSQTYSLDLRQVGEIGLAITGLGLLAEAYHRRHRLSAYLVKNANQKLVLKAERLGKKLTDDLNLITWIICAPPSVAHSEYRAATVSNLEGARAWHQVPTTTKADFKKLLVERQIPRGHYLRLGRLHRTISRSKAI